jgi:hypothetical protein
MVGDGWAPIGPALWRTSATCATILSGGSKEKHSEWSGDGAGVARPHPAKLFFQMRWQCRPAKRYTAQLVYQAVSPETVFRGLTGNTLSAL